MGADSSGDGSGKSEDAHVQSRPRARASAELGARFAEALEQPHAHPYGVCAKVGMSYQSYKAWMRADVDDPETSDGVVAFQTAVLEALEAARIRDIENIENELAALNGPQVAVASSLLNKHMFHHDKRFKRFYAQDDEPKKTELDIGNKDGKAFKQHLSGPITEASRRVIVTEFLGLTNELLDAGAKAGEVDMSAPEDESDGAEP